MRIDLQVHSAYVGNPSGDMAELGDSGGVDSGQAGEMLIPTCLGLDRISADGQQYRIVRSVRYIADYQTVVFTPV